MKKLKIICLIIILFFPGGVHAAMPVFDMDTNGNAVSAWLTYTEEGGYIEANYKIGTQWSTPVTLARFNGYTDSPKIHAAANGNDISAIVLWCDQKNDQIVLYASILSSSKDGWSPATQISDDSDDVITPQHYAKINENGKIMILWCAIDKDGNHVANTREMDRKIKNSWSKSNSIDPSHKNAKN